MADQTFAVHCGFFDAINSDRTYSADEMNRPYKRVISNGVFATPNGTPSTDLQVTASSGMNIICKKGEGLFGDKWFENPSGIAITVPSNTGTVPRIDSVLVQVDTRTSGRVGNIVHRTGTPASSPVPPAINQVEGVVEYRLANIRVNAGVSAITQSMITDRRGSSDCPWVTSLIYQVDTSTLYDQWQAAYAEYFEEEKAIWDAWYAQLTEDLDVSMTLDRHTNTVTTTPQTTWYIPIGLDYNRNTDILEVYINGLRAVEGTHYVVVDDTKILVENQLQIGQEVTFVVMRSVISGSATNIMVLLQELESQIAGIAGGTPTVVDAKADMTEHDKIYILSTDGKWYYYSATAEDWVIGGTYGGVPTDTTLSISGAAADAKTVGDALAEKADSDDVTALDTRMTAVEGALEDKADADDVDELKNAIDELAVPLTLVATYQGKQARATGLTDSASNTVYQFQIPDNCETIHITSYFYGNSRIIFTNSATPIDFSTGQYQQYPSTGYNVPTDIDDDYASLRFKYVYVTFLVTQGKECKASCSAWDIINFIGSNTPIAENTNGNITNFNDAKRNHIYVISSGISNIQNYPPISNGGTLLCYASYNIDNVQLFVSNQTAIYIRRMWGTTWSDWKQIPTADAVQTLVNTAVNTAFSGYYPFNILQAFKNITCIGDSLTYSQVYTGNSTSRQAYKPYPKVIADRAGATETILATPGDTATQTWDRNSENIVQKDAQLTLVYLGTNGGLTDTMDTDMVGDDYTQWADTNTGAYGKIIAKSIAVGSRVVLIKVHSSSGGVAVTNTVIEKMATRFNVPVINNTYLSGTKYHSWPNGGGTNGTHYNDFGYAVFADQIANSISQLSADDAIKIIPE